MIRLMFAIRDEAVEGFNVPFHAPSQGAAVRSFMDAVNGQDPNSPVARHYRDYSLWLVGYFDDDLGCFVKTDDVLPSRICDGLSVRNDPST